MLSQLLLFFIQFFETFRRVKLVLLQQAKMNSIPAVLFLFSLIIQISDQGFLFMDKFFNEEGIRASLETMNLSEEDKKGFGKLLDSIFYWGDVCIISWIFLLISLVFNMIACFKLCGRTSPRRGTVVHPL